MSVTITPSSPAITVQLGSGSTVAAAINEAKITAASAPSQVSIAGQIGLPGPRGPAGVGEDGASAYDIAVANGFEGTAAEWLQSLKGEGGGGGFAAIVNLDEYHGQIAGGTGINLIVPVAEGDPPIELTESATVTIPSNDPSSGIAIWAKSTTSGIAIVLGLISNGTTVPTDPVDPSEPVDPPTDPADPSPPLNLAGTNTVYGSPGTIFPLGIYLAGSTASFSIAYPTGLPLKVKRESNVIVPVSSQWTTPSTGYPYSVTGQAVSSSTKLKVVGTGITASNGNIKLAKGTYLQSDPLALDFPKTADEATTQAPQKFRISFKGVIPANSTPPIVSLYDYGIGRFEFGPHWDGSTMFVHCGRGNTSTETKIISDSGAARKLGTNQLYECEYNDNPGGTGGTVTFYIDGVQFGAPKATTTKLRLTPAMVLEVNASAGNTSNAISNLVVERVGVSFGQSQVALTYEAVSNGAITAADLEAVVVDATSYSTAQAPVTVSYTANGTETTDVTVVVGEMAVPAGSAYKVVLEDWSTGTAVASNRELVMTKPVAQNCRFEDATLYGSQAAWTEVIPQGPVPNINGINYYCEGIRIGEYVQLQFGYDWDATQMPSNPFGDPTNKESYMVPHKWAIYDVEGTLLGRIEQPDGQPLNTAATPACWSGQLDGRGVAIITEDNKFYPKGTVRSGIIWRSHDPVAYAQPQIWNTVPTFDLPVPFASQTGFSVNGGDMRIFGEGQVNGFANYRWMPWESSTYEGVAAAGRNTLNPWKVGSNETGIVPNAGVWLKYTPFNQQGRSPITGPGGTRDDRQMMPEPVARYARDINVKRAHDNRSMKQIALDYLTGYVSDPYHCFEGGRLTPLFKGAPRRAITMRNHYYGAGEGSTPPEKAYYVQGGRTYEWATGYNPLTVEVPYAGKSASKPIFGTNQIDDDHAHQFPHWGSMLWQTPEFAMLGAKFFDQSRLYRNAILNDENASMFAERGAAWKFNHTAMAWKTASSNSSRLYSRKEIMDWIVFDFEAFHDLHYASTPGFLNPPAMITGADTNGQVMAATQHFGPCLANGDGVYQHEFYIGYWMSALQVGEKLGFNAALRAASTKARTVLDWLISIHEKRITGRLNGGMLVNAGSENYICPIWTPAQISAASGSVANLPKTFAAVATAQGANAAPSWDTFKSGANTYDKDGQAMDQLLAGPSLLISMGRSSAALTQADTAARGYRQQKIDSETAKGASAAGSTWFKYLQTTNCAPYQPTS